MHGFDRKLFYILVFSVRFYNEKQILDRTNIVKLVVITLNPESSVVQRLVQSIKLHTLSVDEFYAVDGRAGTPVLVKGERLSQTRSLLNRRFPLTNTEIGCYLSHYRVIKKAYDDGHDHVCILEDDVVLESNFGDVLKEVVSLGAKAEFVRLMALKIRKRKVVQSLSQHCDLVRPLRGSLGTQGYVLNRSGMKKVLDKGAVISMPIDKFYDSFFLWGLHSFTVEPHIIFENHVQSSIAKTDGKTEGGLMVSVGYRFVKLYRSLRRSYHFWVNFSDYSPAEFPEESVGKSQRLRS